MKLVLLTTKAPHHCYFLRELARRFPLEAVLVERNGRTPPFAVHHPFEDARDEYERQAWFGGARPPLADFAPVWEYDDLNEEAAAGRLALLEPEVVVVFGTGRLLPRVLAVCPEGMVNLHGGDPQRHRGVDTHLWAIYEGRFEALVTTLHRVQPELDAGEIVAQAPVPLHRQMALHELRRFNTEVCLALATEALALRHRCGRFASRPQRRRGRYYSFMPAALKDVCRNRFERYTRSLP